MSFHVVLLAVFMYVSDTEGGFADLATPQESILMFETRRTRRGSCVLAYFVQYARIVWGGYASGFGAEGVTRGVCSD